MTTVWDGNGLPPAAMARMERGRTSAVRSSLMPIAANAGVDGCGFRPVGEVMGCIVEQIGWQGWQGCGYYGSGPGFATMGIYGGSGGSGAYQARTVTSGQGGYGSFAPYVEALYRGWDTAVYRMLLECQALGGDGVVDVRLTQSHLGQGSREFLAMGTAVRAEGRQRPAKLFSTTLAGNDFAKLVHGGWMSAAIVVGISVAIRHDDYVTRNQARAWGYNTEVSGYTELVNHVRADARRQLQRRVAAVGADGCITSPMQLSVHAREQGEGHTDHVAESQMFGDAVVRFHKQSDAPTKSLSILMLDS